MKYPKFLNDPDRNVIIGLVVLVVISISYLHYFGNRPVVITQPEPRIPVNLPAKPAPLPYAAPNKTEVALIQAHREGKLVYSVYLASSFYDANHKLQYATYYVEYENLVNAPVTISPTAVDNIGCIAAGNHSFQEVPSIFTTGNYPKDQSPAYPVTSLKAWTGQASFTLGAYEKVQIQFAVDGSCQYLGTQDGQYWWKMGL